MSRSSRRPRKATGRTQDDRVLSRAASLGIAFAAAGLGAGIGWGAGVAMTDDEPPTLPTSDRGRAAVAELRDDRVFVTAESRDLVSAEQEARLETAAAQADPAVHVVVGKMAHVAGLGSLHPTVEALAHDVGRPGVYVVWQEPTSGVVWDHGLSIGYGEVDGDFVGDPTTHLLTMIEQVDGAEVGPDYRSTPDIGVAGGVTYGILGGLVAGLAVMPLALVVASLVRARLRQSESRRSRNS
ncbi:hypothetical protein [Nocardioides pacificus]